MLSMEARPSFFGIRSRAFGNDDLGLGQQRGLERQTQDLAARESLRESRLESIVAYGPQFDGNDSVGKVGHLRPVAGGIHYVMRVLAAVPV